MLLDHFVVTATTGIGSDAGQRLLGQVTEWFRTASIGEAGGVVLFDLSAIGDLATTSFFKASVLPLFQAARLSTEPGARSVADAFGIPALNAFPVIANARAEVEELADEIFGRRGFPLLCVQIHSNCTVQRGRLVGYLDDVLMRTMRSWPGAEPHTAASLHAMFPDEGITQTAWSNRLNDLWRVRLLRRVRQGKSWSYKPIINGVTYG